MSVSSETGHRSVCEAVRAKRIHTVDHQPQDVAVIGFECDLRHAEGFVQPFAFEPSFPGFRARSARDEYLRDGDPIADASEIRASSAERAFALDRSQEASCHV